MRIDIATLFPAMCDAVMHESIIGRAQAEGHVAIHTHNIRDYTQDKHRRVDDYPYGGGCGMLMQPQPIADCCAAIAAAQRAQLGPDTPTHVVFLTPAGKPYDQQVCKRLAALPCLTLVCGHYEGIDQRVIDEIADEEVSIGDYVITGGELAALVVADSVARLQPGVLAQPEGYEGESHYSGLLESPQYTRPEVWRGRAVPQVLLTGHHANIVAWQQQQSEDRTRTRRPDLWQKYLQAQKNAAPAQSQRSGATPPPTPKAQPLYTAQRIGRFRRKYDFLSNFYPAPLLFEGQRYLNSEAAFQAQKCADAADRARFATLSPDEAKRLGETVALRADWDDIRLDVMYRVLQAKFCQNPQLALYLAETGAALLQEGNPWHDTFWGVDLKTGEGQNNLGLLLMRLRAEFAQNGLPTAADALPPIGHTAADGLCVQLTDITQLPCDAVVNAAAADLTQSTGAEPDIYRAAGDALADACAALAPVAVGQAVITQAFRLPAQHIIHAVGPSYKSKNDAALLDAAWQNVLELARQNGLHILAVPAISTGRASFPRRVAAAAAVRAVRAWRAQNPDYPLQVTFATTDHSLYVAFRDALDEKAPPQTWEQPESLLKKC